MFAGDEEGITVVDLTEKVSGTKITVCNPHIAGLNGLQKGAER
jgi:hypothetical protein